MLTDFDYRHCCRRWFLTNKIEVRQRGYLTVRLDVKRVSLYIYVGDVCLRRSWPRKETAIVRLIIYVLYYVPK